VRTQEIDHGRDGEPMHAFRAFVPDISGVPSDQEKEQYCKDNDDGDRPAGPVDQSRQHKDKRRQECKRDESEEKCPAHTVTMNIDSPGVAVKHCKKGRLIIESAFRDSG
jgi:hypothetical protein